MGYTISEIQSLRSGYQVAHQALGCAKNLVDSESMLALIKQAGYSCVADMAEADLILVNTCAFIEAAKREAIDAILQAASFKEGRCRALVVCGCLAQRYAKEIEAELPEVDAILGVAHYKDVVETLDRLLLPEADIQALYGLDDKPLLDVSYSTVGALAHLNSVRDFQQQSYAYLKISEGCVHRCAYCAIPAIRGPLCSRPMEDILDEAKRIREAGVPELILVAQDSCSYGLDLYGRRRFADLLDALAQLDFPRIRYLYGYVNGTTRELLDCIERHENILPYFDIPIQHAADSVLQRMRRPDRQEQLRRCFQELRRRFPRATLRTTVICGYPGETESEFKELLDFVKEVQFDHLGCFTYSPEEGTAAAELPDRVPSEVAEARSAQLMALQQEISQARSQRLIGQRRQVLIEKVSDDGLFYIGRTEAQAPDIDPVCYVLSEAGALELQRIYPVEILEVQDYDLTGVYRE